MSAPEMPELQRTNNIESQISIDWASCRHAPMVQWLRTFCQCRAQVLIPGSWNGLMSSTIKPKCHNHPPACLISSVRPQQEKQIPALRSQDSTVTTKATTVNIFLFLSLWSRLVLSHARDLITLCELKRHSVFCLLLWLVLLLSDKFKLSVWSPNQIKRQTYLSVWLSSLR